MLSKSKLLSGCICCLWLVPLVGLSSNTAFADEKPGTEGDGNLIVGPDYKIDPDLTDRGKPNGRTCPT